MPKLVEREMPKLPIFLTNMYSPMPVRRKIGLFLKNNWLKVYRRRNCCGNLGEPGC